LTNRLLIEQNQPNPVFEQTRIPIWLPKAACGILSIFDVQGRLLLQKEYCLEEGQQYIQLNVEALELTNGFYGLDLDWREQGRQQLKMQVLK